MAGADREVRVRAPGKINLVLAVGGARSDGFHDVATVFHAVDVQDEVTARPADHLLIRLRGTTTGVPVDPTNLAARAAQALAVAAGRDPDVELTIDKAIPVAGGMAGGSADAAAALVACDALWRLGSSAGELESLAAGLGSDVAFALLGGTAVGTGRGELLRQLPAHPDLHWVLVRAPSGLSTPAVYAELDRRRASAGTARPALDTAVDRLVGALVAGEAEDVAAALSNDLQAPAVALAPELSSTLRSARDAGALAAVVCGSGPTVAVLARDAEHARGLAAQLTDSAAGDVRPPLARTARGPVPGAHVVSTRMA